MKAALAEENARLKALLAQTQAALAESEEARRRLEAILHDLRREKFGAKSEKLSPDQFSLALEDVELAQGVLEAAQEKAVAILKGKTGGAAPTPRRNRGRLPAHLPRVERVIKPASTLCPCGCGEMTKIGEDVSERLDVVPAQLRVLVMRHPVAGHMRRHLAGAERLFMDETTAPVLDPGRGQTKKGFFWAIAADDRGHGGPSPPVVLFRYAPGRGGVHAERILRGFRGRFLQCAGYDSYECLTGIDRREGPWTLVHCWSHLRRRFVKQMRNTKSPIAEAGVRQIATLYAIEASVRGMAPAVRLAARQARSAPIVAALKTWFEKQLSMISSCSTLAADIRYALAHWPGLSRFLEDGRLEMDTNSVENAIRPAADRGSRIGRWCARGCSERKDRAQPWRSGTQRPPPR